jgi:hypothetical protein
VLDLEDLRHSGGNRILIGRSDLLRTSGSVALIARPRAPTWPCGGRTLWGPQRWGARIGTATHVAPGGAEANALPANFSSGRLWAGAWQRTALLVLRGLGDRVVTIEQPVRSQRFEAACGQGLDA